MCAKVSVFYRNGNRELRLLAIRLSNELISLTAWWWWYPGMISCGISIKAGVHPYLMKQDLQITSSISRPDALPFVILDNARELQFNGRTFPQFLHCLIAHRLERILSTSKAYLSLTNCGLFTHACHGFTTSLLYKPTTTAQFLLRLCTGRLFTVYETLHKSKLTKTLKILLIFALRSL